LSFEAGEGSFFQVLGFLGKLFDAEPYAGTIIVICNCWFLAAQ
jgi:hypothetical protein